MSSVRKIKLVLWCICGAALPVLLVRLTYGLGAVSNMSDAIPWGLWKGLGVISAIALAAGGFVLTGTIHTFHLKKYHALVRPAVLTAFCGYGTAATSLLFDIGIPWRIWHPIAMWQHHSALFEVAWCVIIYLNVVLILELAPAILERWPLFEKPVAFLRKVVAPIAILGVMISVLHQSTLGTIFLMTPHTLHTLWYSSMLPLFFITSAAATGTMVIVVEFIVISRLYGRELERELLTKLGKAVAIILGAYFVVRLGDVVVRGALPTALADAREGRLFFIEMVVGTLIPCVLLAIPRVRSTTAGLLGSGILVIAGFVTHRLTVSYLGMFGAAGRSYSPTWMEVALTAGIACAAMLLFLTVIENFFVFAGVGTAKPEPDQAPNTDSLFDHPLFSPPAKYSAAFAIAAAVSLCFIPMDTVTGKGTTPVPAQKARGGKVLTIDGNRDGIAVVHKHQHHIDKLGGDKSCVRCHHANLPKDENTDCYECHADMYLPASTFNHDLHVKLEGGNTSCTECHPPRQPKSKDTLKPTTRDCSECHNEQKLTLKVKGATIKWDDYLAPSYTNAMHGLCITCHKEKAKDLGKPHHGVCTTCHEMTEEALEEATTRAAGTTSQSRWVISPTEPLLRRR